MGNSSYKGKNSQSASKYGQIYLQTDKQLYHPGDTVTGNVYLDIVAPFPGTKLCLKFSGKQYVAFVRVVRGQKGQTRTYHHDERKKPIDLTTDIYAWNNEVSPGQYVVPFSFLLPPTLSASFSQVGHNYQAYLTYKIGAFLQPTVQTDPKFKHKKPLMIRDAPKGEWLSTLIQSDSKPVYGGCCTCYQRGTINYRIILEKAAFAPGEEVKVVLELDTSQTQVSCTAMHLYLKQTLDLKAKGSPWLHELPISSRQYPGAPGGCPTTRIEMEVFLPEAKVETGFVYKQGLSKGELRSAKDDLSIIGSTTTGSDITSKFSFEIVFLMDGYMWNLNNMVRAAIPIDIIYPAPQAEKVNAPTNWQPQTMESRNIAFDFPSYGGQVPDQAMSMMSPSGMLIPNSSYQ